METYIIIYIIGKTATEPLVRWILYCFPFFASCILKPALEKAMATYDAETVRMHRHMYIYFFFFIAYNSHHKG